MLGFINKNKILAFFAAMAATQTLLYMGIDESASNTFRLICQKSYSAVESDIKVVVVADEGAISG